LILQEYDTSNRNFLSIDNVGNHLLFIAVLSILSSELIIPTKLTFFLIQANYEMFIDANTLYIKILQ